MPADVHMRPFVASVVVCLVGVLALSVFVHAEQYAFVKKWGSEGTGNGQFNCPVGMAIAPSGNVYVCDHKNHRIQEFTSNGAFVRKWGSEGYDPGQFKSPRDVAVDASGHVYVADFGNWRVQKLTSTGTFLTFLGGSGTGYDLLMPQSVAVGPSGTVYTLDAYSVNEVWRHAPDGTFLSKWGSNGTGDGQFDLPVGLAVNALERVYVADAWLDRIQKFSSSGAFLAKWGSSGYGEGQFDTCTDLAVDALNDVYVCDNVNHRIQKFTSGGLFITKWGRYGSGDGQFNNPDGIAVDAAGNVYVADRDNHRIQKFAPDTPQPDMRARFSPDDPWRFNNRYGSGRGQTLGTSVRGGNKQLFYLSVQNDSIADQTFRIHGGDSFGRWSISYFGRVGGEHVDLTDPITGGAGWEVGPLGPGKQQVFQAEIKTPPSVYAVGGSTAAVAVEAVSQDDIAVDVVTLVVRVRKNRRVDARIKLPRATRWTGNNVYNDHGKGQIRRRSVRSGRNAIYHLSIENEGNAWDSFKITGPKSNAHWRIRYFAALSGGMNVTQEVTGGGWTTPRLKPGRAQELLLSVTPRTDFEGDRKVVRVTATSTGKSTVQDAVKAITTVKSTSSAVCQVTSLAAVPTRAGAQLIFSLSSEANVTATVLNVAGRPIKTLVADRPLAAGSQTLLWNRTSDAGLRVPNGVYLVRVVARDETGREARALATLAVK